MFSTRFSLKDLLIAILITALVTTSLQLAAFWDARPSTMKKVAGPYTELLPDAVAQTANGGTTSGKHKDFDGGWIIPFEVYDLEVSYVQVLGGYRPKYEKKPVRVDLNGDGLLDLMYSVYDPSIFNNTSLNNLASGFQQYIKLQRANGLFETVYTCTQQSYVVSNTPTGTVYNYNYVGHCADPNYTPGSSSIQYEASRWSPDLIAAQFSKRIGSVSGDQVSLLDSIRFIEDTHQWDRNSATFTDVNGDGLQDMVFGGETSYQSKTDKTKAFAILYNNGNGFDVGFYCTNIPNYALVPRGNYCY